MMHKKDARATVQARYEAITDNEYQTLVIEVQRNVTKLFTTLASAHRLAVLSYHANPLWREVPLESLESWNPNCTFEYALLARDAPLPGGNYALIFVPLYGFTLDGYRLGHGAGWYDTLLALQPNALRIGVGTRYGLVDFGTDPHDVPMDIIVTDDGIITFTEVDIPVK